MRLIVILSDVSVVSDFNCAATPVTSAVTVPVVSRSMSFMTETPVDPIKFPSVTVRLPL